MAQTRLKQLREEAVLTVHELAEASGVSDDTISKIENGQRIARPSTLRKLAHTLDVNPQELRRPAEIEQLAGAGKGEAPREAGQLAKEAEEFEEEQRDIPQSAESLKRHIETIKELKELREAELQEIKTGMGIGLRDALPIQMKLADIGLRNQLDKLGVLGFAKAVRANRVMANLEVMPLCHELLRRLEELERLSAEAEVTRGVAAANNYVEEKIGPSEVEAWMHEQSQEQRSPES